MHRVRVQTDGMSMTIASCCSWSQIVQCMCSRDSRWCRYDTKRTRKFFDLAFFGCCAVHTLNPGESSGVATPPATQKLVAIFAS
jgi:hypothetical protein